MAEKERFYATHTSGEVIPGEKIRVEHSVYSARNSVEITPQLTALPLESLQSMREESITAERTIFDDMQQTAQTWQAQAAKTLQLDMAIEYIQTPPVKHTSNEWVKNEYDRQERSNMVYKMNYHVYEDTRYDRAADKSIPVAWQLTWSVRTNNNTGRYGQYSCKIAGQDKKRYTDKSEMEKYLAGRIKTYSHLFTEISPPIPKEHADYFRVNGQLLPGYTMAGEEKAQPAHATDLNAVDTSTTNTNTLNTADIPTPDPPTQQQTAASTATPTEQPQTTTLAEPKTETQPTKDPAQTNTAPAVAAAAPFVLVSDNPKDKLIEITGKLEDGVKGIFESEQYKSYLNTLSKFHNYSPNNCLLIALQKPYATRVGGFNFWRDEMKRPVMKGEKGIKIIAPAPFKAKKTVDKLDANGKPVFKDGKRVKEEKEITVPAFKVTTVFDVSQTDGEPLPQLGVNELTGNVDNYKDFFAAVEKTSPVPVSFEKIPTGAKGSYHLEEKRIAINEGMSELQNLKSLIHETAHVRLHDRDKNAPKDEQRPDRRTMEVEAESIAYTVCQHYGLDTSDYSFGYIAGWSGGKELDVLKSSLETIHKEAAAIISEVDKHLAELTQDKEQTQTAELPATEPQKQPAEVKGNPLWQDYTFLTEKHPDNIVFMKVGDFYEVMGDNAKLVVNELSGNHHVAGRDVGLPERVPLFGVPAHNFDAVIKELVNKDFAVAVAEKENIQLLSKTMPEQSTPTTEQQAPTAERPAPAPSVDLKIVADYFQKQNDTIQAADPGKAEGQAAFSMLIKRLEQANERIPDQYPQLKALLVNAAQSPDLPTLKERMDTLKTDFIQHYSTAVQNTIDTGGKAEPPAPSVNAPSTATKQNDPAPSATTPTMKPPVQGENVAAIEAKVKAGEAINLTDLSDAIKKDKQAAQSTPARQPGKTATGKTGQTRAASPGKSAQEKPSIKEQLAAGKKQLAGDKSTPTRAAAKNKNNGLGD